MQIYILNRARETLATTASIYNDKHTLTLEAGSSSYEFTIDKSDEASHYLESGNYIVLQDDKGKTWLFTILDYEETHNTKTVYAEDAGIELINKAVDIWKGDGPHPFSYYFDLVTKGTPWKLGVNQLAELERTLTYEGRDTGLGRLLSILKGFDNAECTFDVTVKMNAPAEFKINVYKQVGNDRSDVQIVYNSELNDITKKESRAEFVTALAGVGGQIQTEDGSEGGNVDFSELEYNKDGFVTKKGDKFLRAVDANRTFNPGQESYIESFYEYDTQSPSELLNRTLSKLKTYSEPQYTYTADVKVIDASLVLGDTVTILDHDYNPALYLSARVAKLVKSYTDPAQNEIEFTNYRLLSSALADKLARLQVIVNALPSTSRVSAIETNLTKLTKQQEEVIVKVESANGKNTNFYGGSQPENAKKGDSWFYTDEEGNQGIKQYQEGVWVDVISSKFGPKIEADIKQAQADAEALSSEVESAKKQAQEAFAKAVDNATNVQNVIRDVAQAHTDYVNQQADISKQKADLEKTQQDLLANSESIEDFKGKVSKFQVDLDGINSQVVSNTGAINQFKVTENDINQAMKDAQGNIETLKLTTEGFKQQFADTNENIAAIKRNATELSEQLASKVGNAEYQSFKNQTAKELSEKLVRTDLNGYATTAEVKLTADGLKEQYTQLNGKIDGIVVGGKNLLDNSDGQLIMGYGIDNTTWVNGKATLVYNHDYSKTNKASEILPQAGSRNQWYRVNKDEELTQSIIVETDATYNPNGVYQITWLTAEFGHRLITANIDVLGKNKYRLWCSFKWDKDQSCNVRIMDIQNLTRVLQINTSGTYISFYHPQIERGNKPSDWGMSDNDINKKISDTNVSIAKTNETIKTVDGNVTTVKNNLDKTKSIVTQLANLFDVNVGDSSISVTNGGVLVKGKQVHIDGQTLIDNGVIQGAKIADASIGTAKIADAAITSAKIANLDVNKLSGNKSTFVQSVWNGISGNNAKLTNSGIESVSGANRTVISGGKIETNSIVTKDTIHVGQEDPDPRKQWGVDIDNKGFWFGTPVKQPGHTTNNPSDYRYELQGAIRGYGSDYTQNDATGSGTSGLVIGLAEQSMWGGNYGGDFFAIGRYVKNSTQALETASFDPAISYNATNAGFGTYNDTVNIWKNTYVRGYFSAEYEDKTRFYVGANDGDVLFILQDKNNKNVIIDSSTHTGNGLIVKGSQNITNWLGCQDLSVRGNKNSVVQTSQGWTKINAYETAEYYFGDLGTTNTGQNNLVRIDIDPTFKETVNTTMQYQVFLTSYGPGYAWVSERTENYFVIESNTPNLEVGYEIKAKRKGYEGVRLEIDRNMEERTNE